MVTFEVKGMTCGHCAGLITKALKDLDSAAKVTIDIEQHLVSVVPIEATVEELQEAIVEAGYTQMPMV
ncbi:MAG: heavy metal transporter [Candidatus Accumulibacter sp. 66-26]|nr:heavy-metal-associated domain-containing protein [Accumulibacter sp.]OJW51978.1 MAG: heavy metal transporter [Candidatus Accumulibacter sp. 66-26]